MSVPFLNPVAFKLQWWLSIADNPPPTVVCRKVRINTKETISLSDVLPFYMSAPFFADKSFLVFIHHWPNQLKMFLKRSRWGKVLKLARGRARCRRKLKSVRPLRGPHPRYNSVSHRLFFNFSATGCPKHEPSDPIDDFIQFHCSHTWLYHHRLFATVTLLWLYNSIIRHNYHFHRQRYHEPRLELRAATKQRGVPSWSKLEHKWPNGH